MSLRKQIEKSLIRENTEVDAVEDEVMKDSVLAIASADFKEQDVLDLPLTSRKRSTIDLDSYPGISVSRKRYRQDVGMEDRLNEDSDDSGASLDGGLIGFDDEEDPSLDEEEGDGDDSEANTEDGSEDEVDDEEDEVDSEEGEENEEEDQSEDDSQNDLAPHQSKAESGDVEDQSVQMFSDKRTDSAEIQKGLAVREQLRFWESILECRIKLEPSLIAANQLYQLDKMSEFLSEEKSSSSSDADTALSALRDLSSAWGRLQGELSKQCLEIPSDKKRVRNVAKKPKTRDSDEESGDDESIRSSEASGVESDAENSENEAESEAETPENVSSAEPFCLDRSYQEFATFRDSEIERWNEKAKISSGRAAQRDFSAFDQSILKLIESILYDKYRLIRKTQLKRLDYVIYGKSVEKDQQERKDEEDSQQKDQAKKDLVYDPEIFDDGDFYQKLLRDFIEGKSSDDGISKHEKKLMELHRLRIKMKRKIDTKATKGRKLRYVVHQKLVNFMAPVPSNEFSADAESQLMKSLFGQAVASST